MQKKVVDDWQCWSGDSIMSVALLGACLHRESGGYRWLNVFEDRLGSSRLGFLKP